MGKLPKSGFEWWKWKYRKIRKKLKNYLYRKLQVLARYDKDHHFWEMTKHNGYDEHTRQTHQHWWICKKCGLRKGTSPHADGKPLRPRSGARHLVVEGGKHMMISCQEYAVWITMAE
jgi:hypothetical protein